MGGYSSGIFARILNLHGLFSALAPELERRLRASPTKDWEGTLLFATDIGTSPIAITKGRLRPGVMVDPVLELRIPQSMLVRLITGYASLHWVTGTLNMLRKTSPISAALPEEALPVLEALFPKGVPYMWNADIGY